MKCDEKGLGAFFVKYYITGEQGNYAVTNYMELEDIDLTVLVKKIN